MEGNKDLKQMYKQSQIKSASKAKIDSPYLYLKPNKGMAATMSTSCKTTVAPAVLDASTATELYEYLRDNVKWSDGIRSRKGFTRKAAHWLPGMDNKVDEAIVTALSVVAKYDYDVLGIYINFYETGEMWTPNHSHKGSHQLVISLGVTRTLTVGKKSFPMNNGDAIIFGGSVHGVPKEPKVTEGRISIATFMTPKGVQIRS